MEKIVLRYRKKGYTQTQLEAAAQAFAAAEGLTDANMQIYNDYEEITVFDSTGIALQDLASAAAILQKAEQLHVGTTAEL